MHHRRSCQALTGIPQPHPDHQTAGDRKGQGTMLLHPIDEQHGLTTSKLVAVLTPRCFATHCKPTRLCKSTSKPQKRLPPLQTDDCAVCDHIWCQAWRSITSRDRLTVSQAQMASLYKMSCTPGQMQHDHVARLCLARMLGLVTSTDGCAGVINFGSRPFRHFTTRSLLACDGCLAKPLQEDKDDIAQR